MQDGSVVRKAQRGIFSSWVGRAAYRRAEANASSGRWDEALRAYETAIAHCPDQPDWQFQLGNCHEQLGDWSGAATAYELALQLDRSNPHWLYRLGVVQERLGNNGSALHAYRSALEKDDTVLEWHVRCGSVYEQLNKWSDAASVYKRAIGLFPQEVSLYELLASALIRSRRHKAAVQTYRAAITQFPNVGELRFKLGVLYEKSGNLTSATRCLRHAIRLDGENAEWHIKLADLFFQQERWSRAVEAYRQAIACGRATPEVYFKLGLASQRRRDWNSAAEAYQQVHNLLGDRLSMEMHYRLGKFYELRRLWPAASQAYLSSCLDGKSQPLDAQVAGGGVAKPGVVTSAQAKAKLLLEGDPLPYDRHSAREVIAEASRPEVGLPASWWIAASHRLYYLGWVHAAHLAKQAAARMILTQYAREASVETRIWVIKAMVFLGLLSEAFQLAELVQERKGRSILAKIRFEIKLLQGIAEGASVVQGNKDFAALMAGKRIAIVAPGDTNLFQGREIDSYDLIIRPHFHSDDIIAANAERVGRRTNISYYNKGFESQFRDVLMERLSASPIDFIVLPHSTPRKIVRGYVEAGQAARTLQPQYNIMFGGHPLGMLRIVRDLSSFHPKEIKIFCADCYTRPQKYFPGYNRLSTRSVAESAHMGMASHVKHDLGQNFVFLQRLFRNGIFEGDPVLNNILDWPLEHYLDVLEEKFVAQKAVAAGI